MNNFLNIKIYPNNSLSQKGFYILMIFITLPCLFIGGMFFFMGAWPVLGFMGLELILIYIFFKILFHKNNFYEHVTLDKSKFNIHYSNKNKIFNTIVLEPTWIKVNIENKNKTLIISTHGKTIELGKCLALKEKTNLAETIKSALINWKQNSQSANSILKH
mgnify:CR=1 FL=1|tara:strand:+ start:4556 stop:5038 length:483 start_codon:yes stop_codon:yes gene_type:complete